jgi:hypothetical protein
MAQQYLLPCECGQATPVSVAQAGRTITCACGREQTVPTLAGLRRLEPAQASLPAKDPQAASWTPLRGAAFVVGVVLALAGLTLGGYSSYILRGINLAAVDEYMEHVETHDLEAVDQMPPAELLELWKHIKLQGPGQAGAGFNVQARAAYDYWLKLAIGGFTMAAIGIAMSGGSLIGAGSQAKKA